MNALEATDLGKRYGGRWGLRGCCVTVPAGRVAAIVGANGAGKTTLLHLAVGLLDPSDGSITVLGERPAAGPAQLARVGFLAQDAPVYRALTVGEHLRLAARLNPAWDDGFASRRLKRLGLDSGQRAGQLSGGQRAQLALTVAMGKRPELLVLDEPVATLDPLARRHFLQDLMAMAADDGPTILLSSHLLADLERVCDYVVVVAAGRVALAGDVDELLATHRVLTGARRNGNALPPNVVRASHTARQTTVLVRTTSPILDPRWTVSDVGLEDLVIAYMEAPDAVDARPLVGVPS